MWGARAHNNGSPPWPKFRTQILAVTSPALQRLSYFALTYRAEKELIALYREELAFLEECLKVNPKSYGSWQHRCFVMLNTPSPDWVRELSLCTSFLQHDERNCKFNVKVLSVRSVNKLMLNITWTADYRYVTSMRLVCIDNTELLLY